MNSLNEKEATALENFRALTTELKQEDSDLIRFLRARNFDVKKAETQLLNAIKWRKEKNMDAIKEWVVPDRLQQEMPIYFCGINTNKQPVYMSSMGAYDIRPMLADGWKEKMFMYCRKCAESGTEICKENGVDKFNIIFDLDGLTFAKGVHWGTMEFLLYIFKDFEAYYPETLGNAVFINCPRIFWYGYNLIKFILSAHTVSKLSFHDTDKIKWKPELLKKFCPEALPIEFGGTATITVIT